MSVQEIVQPTYDGDGYVTKRLFGKTSAGDEIQEFTLANANGISVSIIEYGAIVRELCVPDRNGRSENIVLAYPDLASYERCQDYIGAMIGRYAGRIKNATIVDGDFVHRLEANHNGHHLHGGANGFHKKIWSGRVRKNASIPCVEFSCISADGEAGLPGRVTVNVIFALTPSNELRISWYAKTDAPTFLNFTHHGYFNLSGDPTRPITDHILQVNAASTLALADEGIPTGDILNVRDTKLDFMKPRQLVSAGGGPVRLDHDFVLNTKDREESLKWAGQLSHEGSGRLVNVCTTYPSLHVYTGGNLTGEGERAFPPFAGVCLETQRFPNSPNTSSFPSTRLAPGEVYAETTVYEFNNIL